MRKAIKIGLAVLILLLIFGGVGYYSYSLLRFSFSDVSVSNVELKPDWETAYYVIIGNPVLAALSVVDSVDLDLAVQIHNPGFLPVVIPSFDYTLYGNDLHIGPGRSPSSITVPPGSQTIRITQRITTSAMQTLITSIVSKGGILEVRIDGKAHLSPLPVDFPFHATRSINVFEVAWNKIKDLLGLNGRIPTSVILDQVPSSVSEGEIVTFTGRLRSDTGVGIREGTITIYDNDPVGDDYMASGVTDSQGRFSITWTAEPMDPLDRTVDVYAKFEGNEEFKPSNSIQYALTIAGKRATALRLNQPPSSITEGDVVTFVGSLTRPDTGAGVAGAVIKIFDSDIEFDDLMASGITASDGTFRIEWTAKTMDPLDRTAEAYAKFEGTEDLDKSQSNQFTINVEVMRKTATVLTLDRPPSSVVEGNLVAFTGKLVKADDGAGIAGVSIKVYDSDIEFDDLIISGNTDSNGRFRLEWTARRMDPLDRTAEVYAKFDGSETMEPSRSPATGHYVITVEPSKQLKTTLTFDPPSSEVEEGSTVTFTGRLVEADTGIPIAGATINIYDSDIDWDDLLASGTTGTDGRFSIKWTAKRMDPLDRTAEVYAKFEGSTLYESSKSSQYTITVS